MNFDNVFSWAEDANGHLVHVDSVPRGLECGCFCPNCHEPLVARQGDILEHGFAHHSNSRSSTLKICYQVTLYKLAEQIIKEKKCVYAPSYYGIFREHLLCFNDVQIDKRYKREDKQPDVIGIAEDGAAYIIELTFEGKVERKEAIDYKNTNHLVINLSGQSMESLERFLLGSEKNKKWLNNDSYFAQIPEVYKKAGKNVRVVPISECDHCLLATDCCGVKKNDIESYLLVENNGQSFRICKDDDYTEKKAQKEEQDKSKTHKNKNGKWLKKISGLIFKKKDSEIRAGSTILYNKEHLIHAGSWGAEFEFLFFWGHHEKGEHVTRACLSQWYPCQFEVDGVQYNCAEQFMMAEKARLFGDSEAMEKILAANDQKTIKDLGRQVRGFDEDKWNKEKVNIVIRGNIAKFSQNWKLKKYLIWTGDKILAEASPYDTIWGIGLKATDERATDVTQWRGENLLGFSLMIVRDKFLMKKMDKEGKVPLIHQPNEERIEEVIAINSQAFPEKGWAIIFAGGSSSGKSTLIREGKFKMKGEILSTDSMGEEIMEVHNNAKYYETHDPRRLAAAEELIHKGIRSRFGEAADRNVRLDFHDPCFSAERISAILSNGAHGLKKRIYTDSIRKYAADGHQNVILDMTGKQTEVEYYARLCREQGYKVAFVWVICNMSQALFWNHRRERTMKSIGVYSGHHNPKKYLPDYLSTANALIFDEVWLVFNSTESWQRPMTAEEEKERIIRLGRGQQGFYIDDKLRDRIISVLGPYEDEKYLPILDMQKLFIRYRLMQKYAADNGVVLGKFEEIVPSFEMKDKDQTEANIASFYKQLGMKEPRLPKQPKAVNNVVEPVRAMYDSDDKYAEAIAHYPKQIEAYKKALKEWETYEKNFETKRTEHMKETLSYLYDFNKNPIDTYSKKVQDVAETIQKAEASDVAPLATFFDKAKTSGLPICFFGAGGAASPATFATQLANAEGLVAQTLTPMGVMTLPASVVRKMQFMAITASGGPVDMQAAVEYLLNISPENVYCLTTNSIDHKSRFDRYDNVVGQMVSQAIPGHAICVNLSIHRDGFVGVNKHVGLSLLLYRAFHPDEKDFAQKLIVADQVPYEARLPKGMEMLDISDLHILYGALGRAAANDMEGRMLEAGVIPAMTTDMKNFTHGRHVFLTRHPQSTILMLVSPIDELFVGAMLKLIPSNRPVIIIRTGRSDMLGALQLMICTFYLSIDICAPRGINPFSPGAPSWGGKLWALKLGAEKRE